MTTQHTPWWNFAEAGLVCLDCACIFDSSHSVRLCPRHVAAREMHDFIYWVVNGDPRQTLAQRLTSIDRRARALLAKVEGA